MARKPKKDGSEPNFSFLNETWDEVDSSNPELLGEELDASNIASDAESQDSPTEAVLEPELDQMDDKDEIPATDGTEQSEVVEDLAGQEANLIDEAEQAALAAQRELEAEAEAREAAERALEEQAEQAAAAQAAAAAQQRAERIAFLENQIAKSKADVTGLQSEIETKSSAAAAGEARNQQRLEYLGAIDSWINANSSTLYGKLVTRLESGSRQARADVEKYSAMFSIEVPEENQLVTIRKKFHKSLITKFRSLSMWALLLLAIPWFFRLPRTTLYYTIFNPTILKYVAGALVLCVVAFVIWRRRRLGKQVWPAGRMFKWIFFSVVVSLILFFWPFVDNFMRWLVQFMWWPSWQSILLSFAGAYFVAVFFSLLRYSASYRTYEVQVINAWYDLSEANMGTFASRREATRLESLTKQVRDWLDLFAANMHMPWASNAEWNNKSLVNVDDALLPLSIRASYAVEQLNGSDRHQPGIQKVVNSLSDKISQVGWRSKAFARLVQVVEQLREPGSGLSIDSLDKDVPASPNHTRKMLRSHIAEPDVLHEVARTYLRENLRSVQTSILNNSDLQVRPVVTEYADIEEYDDLGEKITDHVQPWLEFLEETIGDPLRGNPALSLMAFADSKRNEFENRRVSSVVIGPRRLITKLDLSGRSTEAAPMYVDELDEQKPRVYDISIRVDVAGLAEGIPPEHLQVFAIEARTRTRTPVAATQVCGVCGQADCPAADPTSGATCKNKGI